MKVLHLNLEELLKENSIDNNENNKTFFNSELSELSELSGGKGKKRPKRKSKKKKKKKKKKDDDNESEPEEYDDSDDYNDTEYSRNSDENYDSPRRMGRRQGMGRGQYRNFKLEEDMNQLKDTIVNLEEKILMLSNQLDNLYRKYESK